MDELLPPVYHRRDSGYKLGLAVEEMRRHMTDEGWQLFDGLAHAGYMLCGKSLAVAETNVRIILEEIVEAQTVVLQDKREWDPARTSFRDRSFAFEEVSYLRSRPDVFKATVLKDAHQNPEYHRASAEEIGCHAWIVYYDAEAVKRLAPYVRGKHLVRTYHSVDAMRVPAYRSERRGCLVSGAVSSAYPLRQKIVRNIRHFRDTDVLKHPGYHASGCQTADYMQKLSQYKVAVCTASKYQYALRKLVEATACGCAVVTDLKEALPHIDGNFVRIRPDASVAEASAAVKRAIAEYDPERQRHLAEVACREYDFRKLGMKLAYDLEALRVSYNAG